MQISLDALGASEVPAQQLWSHPVLGSMQQKQPQLETAKLSLNSLSITNISTIQRKIAVLAADGTGPLGLQLLSVTNLDAPIVMGTHALTVTASDVTEGSKVSSRWHCCYSKYGEVLLHRERGSAFVWRLSEGWSQCHRLNTTLSTPHFLCPPQRTSSSLASPVSPSARLLQQWLYLGAHCSFCCDTAGHSCGTLTVAGWFLTDLTSACQP